MIKVTFSFVYLRKHLTNDVMLTSRFFVSYRYDWGRYHWECRINPKLTNNSLSREVTAGSYLRRGLVAVVKH